MRRLLFALLVFALIAPAAVAGERGEHEEYRNEKVMVLGQFEPVRRYPAKFTISGQVTPQYRFSEAILVRPDGSAEKIRDISLDKASEATVYGARFTVPITMNRGKGIYRLELTGTTGKDRTHSGARVLLFGGVPEDHPDDPPPADVMPDKRLPAEMIAADLFDRINAHRKKVGVRTIKWMEPLAFVARVHAADCIKEKKLDHRVNTKGTVVDRMASEYGWENLSYKRPRGPGQTDKGARCYFPTMVESRKGIEPVLHRWQRFAAFCLPMTMDAMTHGACGIARTKGGTCYIIFTFAQVNGEEVLADIEAQFKMAQRAVKHARDDERPDRLREIGLWRRKAGTKEAKKHLKSKSFALRAAAYDVLWMANDEREEARVRKAVAGARTEYERLATEAGIPKNRNLDVLRAVHLMQYDPALRDEARAIEVLRQKGADLALESALAVGEPDDRAKALRQVEKAWPGTEAAGRAEAERKSDE